MSNMVPQFSPAGLPPRHNAPGFYSSLYQKELSFNSSHSASTDLVIETREGDRVTLNSSSFSSMNAHFYTSEGVVQTESGTALFSQNQREITLASGQSFSFSVAGDLSEEELADIEELLKGLDRVMSEMRQGDISAAMEKALSIGSFGTVSAYSAELSASSSYDIQSAAATEISRVLPDQQNRPAPGFDSQPPGLLPRGELDSAREDFDRFFSRLMQQLLAHEEKLLGLAKKPIDKLFEHHLADAENKTTLPESIQSALRTAMEDISSLIEEMMGNTHPNSLTTTEQAPDQDSQ